jgi:hypothetical protein
MLQDAFRDGIDRVPMPLPALRRRNYFFAIGTGIPGIRTLTAPR